MKTIRVNLIAEKFISTANGVYTAVLEAISSLRQRPEIKLTVNGDSKNCDVIHAHSMGLKSVWLSFRYRHKYVLSAHVVPDSFIGSLILSRLWKPLMQLHLLTMYNRARMVIAVSPLVKEELVKLGVKSEMHVLCNSVDREKFKPDAEIRKRFRERFQLHENDFVVICVGQIQPRKGIYEFLETAKLMPTIKFVWIGGRPFGRLTAEYDKLTKAVTEAPSNVLFPGIVDFSDMPGCYAMADVYFLPSYQENFAFATIEASAVKLPLLLRDNVEYPSSLFTHYLKGETPADYASLLETLSTDQGFYKKQQAESDILASKYEIATYTDQLISLYKKVADG